MILNNKEGISCYFSGAFLFEKPIKSIIRVTKKDTYGYSTICYTKMVYEDNTERELDVDETSHEELVTLTEKNKGVAWTENSQVSSESRQLRALKVSSAGS